MTAKKKPTTKPAAKKPTYPRTLWDDPAEMKRALRFANAALSKAAKSDAELARQNRVLMQRIELLEKANADLVVAVQRRRVPEFEIAAIDMLSQQVGKDIDAKVMSEVQQAIADNGGKLSAVNVQGLIRAVCTELGEMLVEKNRSYGNSALDPLRVFSRASAVEQIKVRIDDKLSRLGRGTDELNEDTVRDLIGYLILLRVAERLQLT